MKNTEESILQMLKVFGGEDGGISFLRYRFFMEDMETENSEASRAILKVQSQFAQLIEAVIKE